MFTEMNTINDKTSEMNQVTKRSLSKIQLSPYLLAVYEQLVEEIVSAKKIETYYERRNPAKKPGLQD